MKPPYRMKWIVSPGGKNMPARLETAELCMSEEWLFPNYMKKALGFLSALNWLELFSLEVIPQKMLVIYYGCTAWVTNNLNNSKEGTKK